MAWRAAFEQKFSEAISSSPEHCLFFSCWISANISGSSCSRLSFPVQTERLAKVPQNADLDVDWTKCLTEDIIFFCAEVVTRIDVAALCNT